MLMPSIYGENLFDDFFNDFPFFDDKELRKAEKKLYGRKASRIMSTDVKEKDGAYELEMDLPGFKKDEIQISLENGYLNIQAAKGLDKSEESKETGKYSARSVMPGLAAGASISVRKWHRRKSRQSSSMES